MRNVLIFVLFLAGLGVLSYVLHPAPDCATQLDRCLRDPPLFARLQGMNAKVYCQNEIRACRGHDARTTAESVRERTPQKAETIGISSAF